MTDDERRRPAVNGQALGRKLLGEVAAIVTPDTILRWYRRLVAAKYDGSRKRRTGGTPRTKPDLISLVIKMAEANPRWGYTRIRGAMKNLGYAIGRSTIKRTLKENGIEPAPERGLKGPANISFEFFMFGTSRTGVFVRPHL